MSGVEGAQTFQDLLLGGIEDFPQLSVDIQAQDPHTLLKDASLQAEICEVEQMLGRQGRVLVRASGTEPVVRVMVEHQDARLAGRCLDLLQQAVENSRYTADNLKGNFVKSKS